MKRNNKSKPALEGWPGAGRLLRTWGLSLCCLISLSCSLAPSISVVTDDRIEHLLMDEAARILAVTEDGPDISRYRIYLSDFPRADILGMSIGQRRIYISYRLGRRALNSDRHLWLLRQTLAHEIGHEIAGHANQTQVSFNRSSPGRSLSNRDLGLPWYVIYQPYSLEKELQADLEGMKYWDRLQWDCSIWVGILEDFKRQNYVGDILHPTQTRLEQASRVCRSKTELKAAREASLTPSVSRPSLLSYQARQ